MAYDSFCILFFKVFLKLFCSMYSILGILTVQSMPIFCMHAIFDTKDMFGMAYYHTTHTVSAVCSMYIVYRMLIFCITLMQLHTIPNMCSIHLQLQSQSCTE